MNLKNKKSIYLIIHPCYGKTGTTWIQTHILPQTSILNLAMKFDVSIKEESAPEGE